MTSADESLTLPLSGWRFIISRRPDGTLACFAGSELVPSAELRKRNLRTDKVVSGTQVEFSLGLLRNKVQIIVWGLCREAVSAAAVGILSTAPIPVYRIGGEFWVAEARGYVRAIRITVNGNDVGDYGGKMVQVRGNLRRRHPLTALLGRRGLGRKRIR